MSTEVKSGRNTRMLHVKTIADRLEQSDYFVVNDYRGLTVEQITEVRREIASHGARMHVQKNTLTKIALADKDYPENVGDLLEGPSAITYVQGDISPVLKVLFKYDKDKNFPLHVKGAFLDGVVVDRDVAKKVSSLPSKEQLIAMLMGVMQAPVRNMAVGLKDVIARLARGLQAVSDNKEK